MRLLSLLWISALLGPVAYAAPAQVLIIRHGEKPDVGNELNEQGVTRAKKLVAFFKDNPVVNKYGKIAAIYAMDPHDEEGSLRPIETVQPTADALGLIVDHDYKKPKIKKLYKDIMGNSEYDGKTVLICWEHKVIPSIAQKFGAIDAPLEWDGGDVYDQVWVLRFKEDGTVKFEEMPEHVLPTDSATSPDAPTPGHHCSPALSDIVP